MIEYRFDRERSFAMVVLSGVLEDDAATTWFRSFVADLRGREQVSGLVDTRGLEKLDVTGEAVRAIDRIATSGDDVFAGSRWAIVADQDVVFGMARMYEMVRDSAPYEIVVFRDMDAARAWLEDPEADR